MTHSSITHGILKCQYRFGHRYFGISLDLDTNELSKQKELEREEFEFPDEVDAHTRAKDRFAQYRGLKQFYKRSGTSLSYYPSNMHRSHRSKIGKRHSNEPNQPILSTLKVHWIRVYQFERKSGWIKEVNNWKLKKKEDRIEFV